MITRIDAHGTSDLMPPERAGDPLTEREALTLRRWIEQGASYEPHWAYVAPRLPELPNVAPEQVEGTRNEVDLFVRARLADSELGPRAEASRATLVRRLSLTLWGLPAPLELVEHAIADARADWYERLVDELLAHPRHGEHMARQWLDAARYGDTHGLHLDNERAIHPYRDWVIDAFTQNLPYDEFVIQQLAGDLLPEPTQEQLVATGFNRCNPTTAEGGLIDEEYLAKYAWDRVDTTSTVFLGLTLACAKCHDHKFDPFTMRDYYALYSFFDDMEGEASDENIATPAPSIVVPREEDRERLANFDARVAALRAELDGPNDEWDRGEAEWLGVEAARLAALWRPLAITNPSAEPPLEWRERADGALEVEGALADFGSYTLPFATAEELLALRLELLPGEESGRIGRAEHGNIVLSRVVLERFRSGLWEPQTIATVDATREQPDYEARGVLDDDPATGWALQHFEHEPQALRIVLADSLMPGEYRLVLQFESEHTQHFPSAVRLAATSDSAVAPLVAGEWEATDALRADGNAHPFAVDLGPDPGGDDVESVWRPLAIANGAAVEFEGDYAAVYLRRSLVANEALALELAFGSDDGLRVWVDGAEVLSRDVARSHAPAQDVLREELEPGRHVLLCKVVNLAGGFVFSCELRGARGTLPGERIAQLLAAAAANAVDDDERRELRTHYRSAISPQWAALDAERVALVAEREAFEAELPRTLISRERMQPVATRVLVRGLYDHPGDPVESNVPAVFGALPADAPKNRLALARWIVSPNNPLAARVAVTQVPIETLVASLPAPALGELWTHLEHGAWADGKIVPAESWFLDLVRRHLGPPRA